MLGRSLVLLTGLENGVEFGPNQGAKYWKNNCKLGQWELRENSGSGTILSYSKMRVGHGIAEKLGLILLPSLFSSDYNALGHRHTAARPPASRCSRILRKINCIVVETTPHRDGERFLLRKQLSFVVSKILIRAEKNCHAPSLHSGRDRHPETIDGPKRTLGLAFLTQRKPNSTE
uniref:Late blight resistance protein n=1 Tax=Solanum tuberosum TaxID=4113 RepID=M1DL87_SOLTU